VFGCWYICCELLAFENSLPGEQHLGLLVRKDDVDMCLKDVVIHLHVNMRLPYNISPLRFSSHISCMENTLVIARLCTAAALILLVRWQEKHLTVRISYQLFPKVLWEPFGRPSLTWSDLWQNRWVKQDVAGGSGAGGCDGMIVVLFYWLTRTDTENWPHQRTGIVITNDKIEWE